MNTLTAGKEEKTKLAWGKRRKDKRSSVCPAGCEARSGYHFHLSVCSFGVGEFCCRWNPCLITSGRGRKRVG